MRQLCHFFRVDAHYGTRVARKLGVDVSAFTPGTMQELKHETAAGTAKA